MTGVIFAIARRKRTFAISNGLTAAISAVPEADIPRWELFWSKPAYFRLSWQLSARVLVELHSFGWAPWHERGQAIGGKIGECRTGACSLSVSNGGNGSNSPVPALVSVRRLGLRFRKLAGPRPITEAPSSHSRGDMRSVRSPGKAFMQERGFCRAASLRKSGRKPLC